MAELLTLDENKIRHAIAVIEKRIEEQRHIINNANKGLSARGNPITKYGANAIRPIAKREMSMLRLVSDLLKNKKSGIVLSPFGYTGLDKLLYVTRRNNKEAHNAELRETET